MLGWISDVWQRLQQHHDDGGICQTIWDQNQAPIRYKKETYQVYRMVLFYVDIRNTNVKHKMSSTHYQPCDASSPLNPKQIQILQPPFRRRTLTRHQWYKPRWGWAYSCNMCKGSYVFLLLLLVLRSIVGSFVIATQGVVQDRPNAGRSEDPSSAPSWYESSMEFDICYAPLSWVTEGGMFII